MKSRISLFLILLFTLNVCSFASTYVGQTNGSFRVDESGSATYNIPLNIPAGIAGVQPQLGFSYTSNGADGMMGRGWNFSGISAISRCPKNMSQDDEQSNISHSENDRLCLNGQRLVTWGSEKNKNTPNSSYWSADKYHTEIDDFSIVTAHGNTSQGPSAFTVETKSGEVHYYGLASSVSGSDSLGLTMTINLKVYGGGNESSSDAFVNSGSANLAKTWALKAIKDVKGNYIVFRYHEDAVKGEHYLKEIHYTGRTDGKSPFSRVILNYIDNPKWFVGWSVGNPISMRKLLDSVTIYQDQEVFRHYGLNYATSEVLEEKNYLESIQECTDTNQSNCLPSTVFEWQRPPPKSTSYSWETEPETGYRYQAAVTKNFAPFRTDALIKGESDNRNYNHIIDLNGDGYSDIVYPSGNYWYASLGPYHNYNTRLTNVGVSKKQYAQTIDYNGDGQRDLLVANGESSNWMIISYVPSANSVARCETEPGVEHTCDTYIQHSNLTVIDTKVLATGLEGNAQVADVDGDGLEDIIFNKNGSLQAYLNKDGSGSFTHDRLIGTLPSTSSQPFGGNITHKSADIKTASAIDVNGDGRTDLIINVLERTGSCSGGIDLNAQECGDAGRTWTKKNVFGYQLLISDGSNYILKQKLGSYDEIRVTDLNGDGYTDLMYQKNTRWYYRLSNGIRFLEPRFAGFSSNNALDHLMYFIDLNADGRADVLYPTSSSQWDVMLSRPSSTANTIIFEKRGFKSFASNAAIRFGDMNGDGKLDLLTSSNDNGWRTYLAIRANLKEHVINRITNGWGIETAISYKNITDENVYFRQDSSFNVNSDYFSPKAAFYVVDNVSTQTTVSDSVSVDYQYGGLLLHKKGRGLAGFEVLRTIDNQSGVVTETAYDQHWPYIGMPLSTVQMKDIVLLSSSNNTLKQRNTASGGVMPYISQSTEQSNSLGTDLNKYEISKTASTFIYDSYGNVTKSTVHIRDAENNNNRSSTYINNIYGSNMLYKLKGRLTYATVQKALYNNGKLVSNITRKSSFSYYPSDLLIKTSTISPENSKTKQTTTYVYDAAGNQTEVWSTAAKDSVGGNLETRKSYTTFDSRYRYVQSIKNHLNEPTTFTYNGTSASAVRGLIDYVETTDTNGIKSRKYQNLLGQTTQSRLNGKGPINSYSYQDYCANSSCANRDAYVRIRSLADGQTEKQQFLDAWGRKIESRVKLQDGSWSVSKTTYDSQGRVKRSYEPGKNSASSYYSEPSYDILGRVTENRQANGGFTEIERSGKQSFTTNAKGQRSKILRNYLGQNVSVFDMLTNELRYQYNAYGQLLNVRAIHRSNVNSLRTSATYDVYGNKLTTNDQDKGVWLYTYSGFGELLTQTDAKAQSVSFVYDELGRKTRRYDASGTVCWDFGKLVDKATYSVGKLKTLRFFEGKNEPCGTSNSPSYQQKQTYHSYGLPYQQTVKVDGVNYTSATTHDNYNRVYTQTYPANNFIVRYIYQNGYMTKQLNHKTGRVYRHIESVNGRGQATNVKYANGSSEKKAFQSSTGWLTNIDANIGAVTLHGFDYKYDKIGNLTDRDAFFGVGSSSNFAEHYGYDDLNRVTSRTIAISSGTSNGLTPVEPSPILPIDECDGWGGGGNELLLSKSMLSVTSANSEVLTPVPSKKKAGDECMLSMQISQVGGSTSDNTNNQYYDLPSQYRMNESYSYDDWGNIKYKQNAGYYKYDTYKTNRLLGVYQRNNLTGTQYYNISYDANGNVTNDGKRTSHYTNFDKPYLITQSSSRTSFSYGPNREVYKRVDTRAGKQTQTLYLGSYERVKLPSGVIEHKFYIGNVVITERSNNANDEFYLHKDHQGSTTSITNASGSLMQQFIYDPWGKQYNVHSNSIFNAYSSPAVSKGYTGHKMVNDMDIIHMNGRIYDPTLGRFLQADPFIQAPKDSQSYNRYTYGFNNPLSGTDPSGYGWLSDTWKKIKKVVIPIVAVVAAYYGYTQGLEWLSSTATISTTTTATTTTAFGTVATTSTVTSTFTYATTSAYIGAGAISGAVSGAIMTGSLKGTLVGAFTGSMFGAVNTYYGNTWNMERVGATSLAGGVSSKAAGGNFADGAKFAFAAAMMRYGYNKLVGYDTTWESGGDSVQKRADTPPVYGANNIGRQGEPLNPDGWFNEGGIVSRAANQFPGVNAVSGPHDVFQVGLGGVGDWARNVFNVPGMVPATVMAYGALMTDLQLAATINTSEWDRRND
ncbi:MAG: FG-GAP-like repeat-containing protein [Cognaticolwellia sp.]